MLMSSLQKRCTDPCSVHHSVDSFVSSLEKQRSEISKFFENVYSSTEGASSSKRSRCDGSNIRRVPIEATDIIIFQTKERFSYSGHLIAAALLDCNHFSNYEDSFPTDILKKNWNFIPFSILEN